MDISCIRPSELARRLGISRNAVYDLVNRQEFYPAFRVGKSILISVPALEKWVEEQTCEQPAGKAV